MRKTGTTYLYLLLPVVLSLGCKKLYTPPAVSVANNFLVIEGVIEAGTDSTFIKLSRTVKLSSTVTANPETGAVATVEGDNNTSYPLIEVRTGVYASPGLNLDATHNYRLRIKTSSAKEYLSDYVAVANSPQIDSVNYTIQSNGANIYVNTHDPKNNTRYYRWDYQETWIIHSFFDSKFVSNGDTILPRNQVTNNIYQCWQSDTSSTIYLGTSAKLTNDIISQNLLTFISSKSEKFTSEYSIIVKQYALTPQAYDFWQNIQKNTEQLGSIFDAQPSEIPGNFHCISNPSEPVIGYLSVGATASQRIFIRQRYLPAWEPTPVYDDCELVKDCCFYDFQTTLGPIDQADDYLTHYDNNGKPFYIPIDVISAGPGAPPLGYTATSIPICVDCTIRGTNKEPSFWVF